jgi:hypothetical protein
MAIATLPFPPFPLFSFASVQTSGLIEAVTREIAGYVPPSMRVTE